MDQSKRDHDVCIENHGSLFTFALRSERAREEEDGPEAAERRAEEVYADQMSRAAQWLEREGLL